MPDPVMIKTADVIHREDLYPRIKGGSPRQVELYQQSLDQLPPIEVNQDNILIDGWHRWMAHREEGREALPAKVTQTTTEDELYFLSAERNAHHGLQLSMDDKRKMAREMFARSKERLGDDDIARRLKVSPRAVRGWLTDVKRAAKEHRDLMMRAMWLRCHTRQEVADTLGVSPKTVDLFFNEICNSGIFAEITNFKHIQYNHFTFEKHGDDNLHFGHTESRIVENLLYGLDMKVGDVVVDPFAGSGSTLDVCSKYGYRCWLGDLHPTPKRETEIREHDIVNDGIPRLPTKDVRLVYLDPPYWEQAKGKYSESPADFGNMPIDEFHSNLVSVIKGFAEKVKQAGGHAHIALIIQPTQWLAPGRKTIDHAFEVARDIKLPLVERIACPMLRHQYQPQQVTWAQENKKRLVLTREVWIWEVS